MLKIRHFHQFNSYVSMITGTICKCYYIFGYESGIYHPVWNDKKSFLAYLVI